MHSARIARNLPDSLPKTLFLARQGRFYPVNGYPDWNAQGLIPPLHPLSPTSAERSPYRVSLTDLVLRFGLSRERQSILNGLLDFRSALHRARLVKGFQWVDGSFLEHIEQNEKRDPADIDVVTLYYLPEGTAQESLMGSQPGLFDPRQTKREYHVDGYFVHLQPTTPETPIEKATYWYSLWSHRRDSKWKGYLQIDLAPVEDAAARASLNALATEGQQDHELP